MLRRLWFRRARPRAPMNWNAAGDEGLPVAAPVLAGDEGLPVATPVLAPQEDFPEDLPQFLIDLIRENLPCSLVLSGPSIRGCSCVVQHIRSYPTGIHFECSRTGRTPLHEAALRCFCRHIVQAITEESSDLTMCMDYRNNTPLHLLFLGMASRSIDPEIMAEIVDLLLQPSAVTIASMRNSDGNLPIHCACALPESMIPRVVLERLINASPASAAQTNANLDQTPLHLHCQRRNASREVAEMLIDAYPEAIRAQDRERQATPLHYAAQSRNSQLIELLVKRDPFAARSRTLRADETPLHILCRQQLTEDDLPAVLALLKAASEIILARSGVNTMYTPVHLLCRGTKMICLPVLEALVSDAPDSLGIVDHNQYLPFHFACETVADPEVIRFLLKSYPAAAKAVTRKGDTALSLACTANHSLETIRILLEANSEAALYPNDYGFVPLHCICRAYQASPDIIQLLVEACPSALLQTTNAGELAIHLASSNTAISVKILEILTTALKSIPNAVQPTDVLSSQMKPLTSTIGNTPLHSACFREFSLEHIETLAESNPDWITVRNNAGYSPLQMLCKSGRIDSRIVTLFSRLRGPSIFATVDRLGNTPLHSSMREETDVEALRALIRSYPDALRMKTIYEDTPLHLACLRRVDPSVVREVALASCTGLESALANCRGHLSPLLMPNTAGQTPISITMEEYYKICSSSSSACCDLANFTPEQKRCFDVLATLAKVLHYGPSGDDYSKKSLLGACVALHRRDARLDPAFICRALQVYPEEAALVDDEGNYPLHVEANIPVEKMRILDAPFKECCPCECHGRIGILHKLIQVFPAAIKHRNKAGDFPLNLMMQNGRPWDNTFALILRTYPEAFHWISNVKATLTPLILARVSDHCGRDTLFAILPSFAAEH